MPFIDKSPLNYKVNTGKVIRKFQLDRPPTSSDYRNFEIGDEWHDKSSDDWWKLCGKTTNSGIWRQMAGTPGATETLTGDSGGAVGPDGANNINILGNSGAFLNGIQITGTPASNTLDAKNLRNITNYVVDPVAGETEYQTIQSALDAANAAGGGTVYVKPGTYTENLTLYTNITLQGSGLETIITGVHTPPASGQFTFYDLTLTSPTDIVNSAAAGTALILFFNCLINCDNGYTANLLNWTGTVNLVQCAESSTDNGVLNNTGGAIVNVWDSVCGSGTPALAITGGTLTLYNSRIVCPITISGACTFRASMGCSFANTLTTAGTSTNEITNSTFSTAANIAITHNSSNTLCLSHVTIISTAAPDVITGTGAVEFGSVSFPSSSSINATVTKVNVTQIETGRTHIGTDATNNTYYLDVAESNVGGNVRGRYFNSDNTSGTSSASLFCVTGGTSAGDPYIKTQVTGGSQYSIGVDNSDADKLKITDGANPSAGNETWVMTSAGERTMPLQPAFAAYLSATIPNATGAGAIVSPIIFDTEIYDVNGDYDTTTGLFTAPVTGKYFFESTLLLGSITAGMSIIDFWLVTSNRNYYSQKYHPGNVRDSSNDIRPTGSFFADMDAGDTAQILISILNGGGNTASITGATASNMRTRFTGFLVF